MCTKVVVYFTYQIFKINTQNILFEIFLKNTILYGMTNYIGKTPGCYFLSYSSKLILSPELPTKGAFQ